MQLLPYSAAALVRRMAPALRTVIFFMRITPVPPRGAARDLPAVAGRRASPSPSPCHRLARRDTHEPPGAHAKVRGPQSSSGASTHADSCLAKPMRG